MGGSPLASPSRQRLLAGDRPLSRRMWQARPRRPGSAIRACAPGRGHVGEQRFGAPRPPRTRRILLSGRWAARVLCDIQLRHARLGRGWLPWPRADWGTLDQQTGAPCASGKKSSRSGSRAGRQTKLCLFATQSCSAPTAPCQWSSRCRFRPTLSASGRRRAGARRSVRSLPFGQALQCHEGSRLRAGSQAGPSGQCRRFRSRASSARQR